MVWVDVDKAMMDDILGPRVQIAEQLESLKMPIRHRERVVVIADHYTPPANARQAEIVKFTRDWSAGQGIDRYYEFQGPCHQIMAEQGHVLPGTLILAPTPTPAWAARWGHSPLASAPPRWWGSRHRQNLAKGAREPAG